MRTLVAGFGNALRGDDGFGVEVVRRLGMQSLGDDISVIDVGTGGMHLAYELLSRYDRVVIVDAMTQGKPAGTLYVREVASVEPESRIDPHLVLPARALGVAKALGVLPASIILIGCEPLDVDELTVELSPAVSSAVDVAVKKILELLDAGSRAEAHVERR